MTETRCLSEVMVRPVCFRTASLSVESGFGSRRTGFIGRRNGAPPVAGTLPHVCTAHMSACYLNGLLFLEGPKGRPQRMFKNGPSVGETPRPSWVCRGGPARSQNPQLQIQFPSQ
jgi:hypothetical protein